jgi:hypothetical protein
MMAGERPNLLKGMKQISNSADEGKQGIEGRRHDARASKTLVNEKPGALHRADFRYRHAKSILCRRLVRFG